MRDSRRLPGITLAGAIRDIASSMRSRDSTEEVDSTRIDAMEAKLDLILKK